EGDAGHARVGPLLREVVEGERHGLAATAVPVLGVEGLSQARAPRRTTADAVRDGPGTPQRHAASRAIPRVHHDGVEAGRVYPRTGDRPDAELKQSPP